MLSAGEQLAIPSPTISPLDDPVIRQQLYHGRYDDPSADRRRYHPQTRFRAPDALIKAAARLAVGHEPYSLHFRLPRLVKICLRRKSRREVLFALDRMHKKGRGGGKPRKRDAYFRIGC